MPGAGTRRSIAVSHSSAPSTSLKLLHDLRSPLTAILGFSELLEDGLVGPLNERQLRYVQQVLTAGRTMLALLDECAQHPEAQQPVDDSDQSQIFPESKVPAPKEQ